MAERDQLMRRIFAICQSFDLGRGERLEVATVVLDRNVESFNDLSTPDLRRIADAFGGAVVVCTIQMERRKGQRV